MWRDWLLSFGADACFAPPASASELAEGEQTLGVRLPEELRNLLAETDGVSLEMQMPFEDEEPFQISTVWPLQEMIEQNEFY